MQNLKLMDAERLENLLAFVNYMLGNLSSDLAVNSMKSTRTQIEDEIETRGLGLQEEASDD